jgi:hypothetical protein
MRWGCLARYPTNVKVLHWAREARSAILLLARSALAPGARETRQPRARKYVEPKVLARSDHELRMRLGQQELTAQARAIFQDARAAERI